MMTPRKGPISSKRNPTIAAAARLHRVKHRRESGRTLIEGPQVVSEALAAGVQPRLVFALDDDTAGTLEASGVDVQRVTEPVLRKLAGTETPRGPIAVIDIPASTIPTDRRLLVAWGVADPGNCGTLIRTAAAFGYGYVSGPGSADVWSPKVLRSAVGGHFQTTIGTVDSHDDLAARTLVGTVAEGGDSPGPMSVNSAVIVGSEARGLPPELVDACDRLITIPMHGPTESLNAAVAGAIVAYLGAAAYSDPSQMGEEGSAL